MVQNARDWYCNSHEKQKEKKKGKGERDKRPTICIKKYEIANHVQQREKTDVYYVNAAYPKTDSQALTTHHDII